MKSLTTKIILTACLSFILSIWDASAQYFYTDPITGSLVEVQTQIIGGELDKSATAQTTTAAANMTMTVLMDSIRSYDKIMLKYLQKANDVFSGIFHAADAIDMGSNIVRNLGNCLSAAKDHPQGAIVTAIVNKRYSRILTEIGSLTSNIANFVRASGDGNLINSAERLDILYDIHSRMRALNRQVTNLYWEILTLEWTDLGRFLNPDIYYAIHRDERLFNDAKRRIDRMFDNWD